MAWIDMRLLSSLFEFAPKCILLLSWLSWLPSLLLSIVKFEGIKTISSCKSMHVEKNSCKFCFAVAWLNAVIIKYSNTWWKVWWFYHSALFLKHVAWIFWSIKFTVQFLLLWITIKNKTTEYLVLVQFILRTVLCIIAKAYKIHAQNYFI